MCYNISIKATHKEIIDRFNLEFDLDIDFSSDELFNGFTHPKIPVITNDKPDKIQLFDWGLIPYWIKSQLDADQIKKKTLNARSETLSLRPSFKHSIGKKHCLVLADGFYEWRHENNKKIKHYIYLPKNKLFTFAGIWDTWINRLSGEIINSFSIITKEASGVMEYIHNTKKREPIILNEKDEKLWINMNNSIYEIFKNLDNVKLLYNSI